MVLALRVEYNLATRQRQRKITIDVLAVMIQKGFQETARKEDMEKGFEEVEKRFGEMDGRMDKMDGRMERMEGSITHIDARLDTIEHDIADIRKHFVYRDEFENALTRIEVIEKSWV